MQDENRLRLMVMSLLHLLRSFVKYVIYEAILRRGIFHQSIRSCEAWHVGNHRRTIASEKNNNV